MNELIIMGIPNVGKSTLIKEISQKKNFFIPQHVTNRMPRKDDTNFYKFKKTEYFKKNEFYELANDDEGIYYGVPMKNIRKYKNKILVINTSIKNIKKHLSHDDKKFVCVISSKNPEKTIRNCGNKYSNKEIIYRIKETTKEMILLEDFIDNPYINTYYIEDYCDLTTMFKAIQKEIKGFFEC
ncbi:GTPase [Staphylococcus kloosii]|uniref:GTPase n=1 Tax=Staphylococcus kloosii TaxID=29384 RepID=UPI0028A57687|nr:GTPase [Staphylococcus kloosii]MDT3959789.1 GTPase [Staphylococcus kloosii]